MADPTTTTIPTVTPGASLRLPLSWQEYQALGETPHTEYAGGLLFVNPPVLRHARVIARLGELLTRSCPPSHEVLTGAGWRTGPERDRIPDIMMSDRAAIGDAILEDPPPLLVVEVTSPSTRDIDTRDKRAEYGAAGAGWYWIVEQDEPLVVIFEQRHGEMIEVQRLTEQAVTAGPVPVTIDPEGLTRA
ncbi:MAG: Uma2 family endonuclease [Actinomycetota bacterium]|nr:Uma2 family endonuclease [Actinomycetota bacterium]